MTNVPAGELRSKRILLRFEAPPLLAQGNQALGTLMLVSLGLSTRNAEGLRALGELAFEMIAQDSLGLCEEGSARLAGSRVIVALVIALRSLGVWGESSNKSPAYTSCKRPSHAQYVPLPSRPEAFARSPLSERA